MTAHTIRCLFPCVLVAALLVASAGLAAPPNVVLIVCDDQAWFHFGFMGNDEIRTPHLDRLATQSAVFTRGYVPSSVCRPSLATMITGRYPHEHRFGVGLDGLRATPERIRQRFQRHPPLPEILASHGYLSLQTGKWWEGDYRLAGFTHGMTDGKPGPGSVASNEDKPTGRTGLGKLDRGLSFLAGAEGLRIGRGGHQPIRDFLHQRGDRPFFLWYAPMMPHTPHNPPERILRKYRSSDRPETIAKYMSMCEWFDECCGELLTLLDEQGLSDETLIAFVVDNGYIQLPGINWFDKRSKLSPYEAGIRTPILLRWPGRIKPSRSDVLVHSIDLAPTILAACGVQPPAELPGINLLDVCDGHALGRDTVFGSTFRHQANAPREPADRVDYRWCVSGRWKLIAPRDGEAKLELYDVVTDPHEMRNLASAEQQRMRQLGKLIDEWWPLD